MNVCVWCLLIYLFILAIIFLSGAVHVWCQVGKVRSALESTMGHLPQGQPRWRDSCVQHYQLLDDRSLPHGCSGHDHVAHVASRHFFVQRDANFGRSSRREWLEIGAWRCVSPTCILSHVVVYHCWVWIASVGHDYLHNGLCVAWIDLSCESRRIVDDLVNVVCFHGIYCWIYFCTNLQTLWRQRMEEKHFLDCSVVSWYDGIDFLVYQWSGRFGRLFHGDACGFFVGVDLAVDWSLYAVGIYWILFWLQERNDCCAYSNESDCETYSWTGSLIFSFSSVFCLLRPFFSFLLDQILSFFLNFWFDWLTGFLCFYVSALVYELRLQHCSGWCASFWRRVHRIVLHHVGNVVASGEKSL